MIVDTYLMTDLYFDTIQDTSLILSTPLPKFF